MDNRVFRDAMGKFATGVTIVATEDSGVIRGMTVNAFMSVSLNPRLIAISIDENASLYRTFQEKGKFGISILREDQRDVSMIFAKQMETDREVPFEFLEGNPVIPDALTSLSCVVKETATAGDHMIFIAEVIGIQFGSGEPLLFFGGNYQSIE